MFALIVFCRLLTIAVLLLAASLIAWPVPSQAGDTRPGAQSRPGGPARVAPRDAVIGGYSTTLSEIWGVPEMPPAPKDFGPHFDFPPESLNGPPLHDPYPN